MTQAENLITENGPALIVAHDEKLGIGKNNDLPWRIRGDLKFFRDITTQVTSPTTEAAKQNLVIMGRKTWESLPAAYKPLPNRINLVLTKDANYALPKDVKQSDSLEKALQLANDPRVGRIFVIGGASIYKKAIELDIFSSLYVTEIAGDFNCDVFFPEYRGIFSLINASSPILEGAYSYCFKSYQRL